MTLLVVACGAPPEPHHESYASIVQEEDARGAEGLTRIRAFLDDGDPRVRAKAVRALGRLESQDYVADVARALADADAVVRIAAVTALGQAVYRGSGTAVLTHIEGLAEREGDPAVLGALATTAGRLRPRDASELERQIALLERVGSALPETGSDPQLIGRTGLARGLETFVRQNPGVDGGRVAALGLELATVEAGVPDHATSAARVRSLATSAIGQVDRLLDEALDRAIADPEPEVRRQALLAITRYGTDYDQVIPRLLGDSDGRVRITAQQAYERWLRPRAGCAPLLSALSDPEIRVALTAADLLARPCPQLESQRETLAGLAARILVTDSATASRGAQGDSLNAQWHLPARSLWALGGIAPAHARERLRPYFDHPSPFARAWAARAATQAGDQNALERLAGDPDPNVRTAAIQGLASLVGGRGVDFYRPALDSGDPQLVMTAARLLPASDEAGLASVLRALERFTATGHETSRDVRLELVRYATESPFLEIESLVTYVADFDPAVAQRTAEGLASFTGESYEARPEPLPRTPPPSPTRLARLHESFVVLDMARGGRVVVELRPDLAATNADRFARLAEDGYFDGLTFHRIVPNFVVQGGSPGANEYAGDGPFSRDEISAISHWRGTVGLSTRGRDTGDAQIFVNLVNNPRLDFNYTIYGEVVEGMEIIDALLEGDVILRARLTQGR